MKAGSEVTVGDWVEHVAYWEVRVNPGFGIRPYTATYSTREDIPPEYRGAARTVRVHAKVTAVDGDTLTVERWQAAKITRQRKAFGALIDHTPYRVGYTYNIDAAQVVRTLRTIEAESAERRHQAVMRLPTHGQRKYQREKRNKERQQR